MDETPTAAPSPEPAEIPSRETPAPARVPVPPAPTPATPPGNPWPATDPAISRLVSKICSLQRPAGSQFHLLTVTEEDEIRIESFEDIDPLVSAIRGQLGRPVHLVPFLGTRLTITRGPHRYLRTPYGAVPLFDIEEEDGAEDEATGWVGPSSTAPDATAPTSTAAASPVDTPLVLDEADDDADAPTGGSDTLSADLPPY